MKTKIQNIIVAYTKHKLPMLIIIYANGNEIMERTTKAKTISEFLSTKHSCHYTIIW